MAAHFRPTPDMIRITQMTRTDLPAVMDIEMEGHPDPWSIHSFEEELDRDISHSLVARSTNQLVDSSPCKDEIVGAVVGYIVFWSILDEVQILNLAVHNSFRRRGIGRNLLGCAIQWGRANSARAAILEVRKSNSIAISLYESMGFCKVGERADYYAKIRESALLMELRMDTFHWAAEFTNC